MRMRSRRDVRIVTLARFTSNTGAEAAFFVGLWGKAAFLLDAGAGGLALLMLALNVSGILGGLAGGFLVDRYGPRRVLIASELLFSAAALALVFAQNLTQLILLSALWALVPVTTVGSSFAPYLVGDDEELKRANSLIQGGTAAAMAAGPALGALIVRFADIDWVFLVNAATSLSAALLITLVTSGKSPMSSHPPEKPRPIRDTLEGFRVVYSLRALRYYVLAGMAVWLAFGAFGPLEPIFFRDVVGTDIEAMGWVNAVFGAGFVLGALLLPRLPRSIVSARGLAIVVGLTGMGVVLYVGSTDLRIIALGAAVWSVVIGVHEPQLRTLLHRDSPPELIGRVQGVAELHHRVGEMMPLAVAPLLAARFGVQATLIAGGLVATMMAIATWTVARRIDADRASRPDQEFEIEGVRASDDPKTPVR